MSTLDFFFLIIIFDRNVGPVNAVNARTEFLLLWKLEIFWRTERGCVLLAGTRTPTCMYGRAGWGLRVADEVERKKKKKTLVHLHVSTPLPQIKFTEEPCNKAANSKQLLRALAEKHEH